MVNISKSSVINGCQMGMELYPSSSSEFHPEATVSELINQPSSRWNIQLIDRCFHPPNAARIKALPLCSTPQLDVLIWPP